MNGIVRFFRNHGRIKARAPEIIEAVQMANALRESMGEKTLKDLPKGKRRKAEECILARAFNFNCTVSNTQVTSHGFAWVVNFPCSAMNEVQNKKIRAWAKEMGLAVMNDRPYVLTYVLPPEIGRIAARFDNGDLPEYEEKPS